MWHRTILVAAVLLSGCGYSFKPITDEEVRALGITEGVAGNAAKKVGNCMPGTSSSASCGYEALDADLWLIPEADAPQVPASITAECRGSLEGVAPATLNATVKSLQSGRYGASLSPGKYMPLIVEGGSCGSCVGNEVGTDVQCPLIEVAASTVTKVDVVLDRASY